MSSAERVEKLYHLSLGQLYFWFTQLLNVKLSMNKYDKSHGNIKLHVLFIKSKNDHFCENYWYRKFSI